MRYLELHEAKAAKELKDKLPSLKDPNYDTIDNLMKRISKRYDISGKKLHDLFVSRYGHTPDHWIKAYNNKLENVNEFASAGGGGGNYFKELASAWYNGVFDTGSLPRGIKTQEDVERLLNRGIVCPDGKTRKLHIDYNSDFDGVEIYSDDYYEYGDYDDTIDSRTGQKWGPYDFMAFSDEDLSESLNEFAPSDDDSNEPDEDEILKRLAKQWWLGTEQDMNKAQRTLASMGWEIGEDEGSYDNGGVFVVRAGDVNGNSYMSWSHEDLSELDEDTIDMPFGSISGQDVDIGLQHRNEQVAYSGLKRLGLVDTSEQFLTLQEIAKLVTDTSNIHIFAFDTNPVRSYVKLIKMIGWNKDNPTQYDKSKLAEAGWMSKKMKNMPDVDFDKYKGNQLEAGSLIDLSKNYQNYKSLVGKILEVNPSGKAKIKIVAADVLPGQKGIVNIGDIVSVHTNYLKKSSLREAVEGKKDSEVIKDFIKWSIRRLHIKQPYPKIILSTNTEKAQAGHHTGVHNTEDNTIWIYTGNRNLIDILRTVFHELVHERQSQLNMIKPGDSYPGSPIEAMADMLAGKYIKIYGKDHPEIFQ